MKEQNVYSYIKSEVNNFKIVRVPLTNSKDWNMSEHIERCFNVANGWFHQGKNDGSRPYDDIVTPIIDVAFRLEGFNVKDIVPYVDQMNQSYKSFVVKSFHPQWAKKNQLDTLIDEVTESSIIYDLALIKDVNSVRPELVHLQDIAFCDQTDVLSGPICIRHQATIPELLEFEGKWENDKIKTVIALAKAEKLVSIADDQTVKTPGKYIEYFELSGSFPESWLYADGDENKYVYQMHIINYYITETGDKQGITLYKGKDKPIRDKFKALKIDTVRSKGRACGRSIVERLFEPQVWRNYSGIKLKKMLDSAVNLLQTDSNEYGNKKLSELKENTILKHEPGKPISKIDMGLQNVPAVQAFQDQQERRAMRLGSASEASLGENPVSGTPFSLQNLVVQQGEGIHDYRQGKIATFFSDVLYPDLILPYLVKDMNKGQKFSEELSLDELEEVANMISVNESNKRIAKLVLQGKVVTQEEQDMMLKIFREQFKSKGNRGFFEILEKELEDIPVKVKVNIVNKQKDMIKKAEVLTNVIQWLIKAAPVIQQIPGIGKTINELLENSNLSPISFAKIIEAKPIQPMAPEAMQPQSPALA